MATVDIECFQDEYYTILNQVAGRGLKRTPRGMPTRDLGHTTIVVHDLSQPILPLRTGRGLGKTVAALETLQVIAGLSTPDLLVRAAPRFDDFAEHDPVTGNLTHFHGAYGNRIRPQMHAAISKLKSDPDTRQAVITLWDPMKDNLPHKHDYPCTVALGLSIVDEQLQLQTLMRSNDAWLGLPNDVFVFTQLQWTVAHALDIEPGAYIHTAWSLHLYDRDIPEIDRVGPAKKREYQPTGLVCSTYDVAQQTAANLLAGESWGLNEDGDTIDEYTFDWLRWYVDAIAPVMG